MDAPYWSRSFAETTPGGWTGKKVVKPPSNGNYYVTDQPNAIMVRTKQLNPYAKEWSPKVNGAPEEDRCLFITFSNGHPISEHQIARFFISKYGDCLERIYVHWPQPKSYGEIVTPQFGKVVFKASYIPMAVTHCGKKHTKFMIGGRPLWCKKFESNKTNASRRN